MKAKLFEIRDRGTTIVAMAVRTQSVDLVEAHFLKFAGWSTESLILTKINGGTECNHDVFGWDNRTMREAHKYIDERFEALETGAIVDIEYILSETKKPKRSDIITPF